VELNLERQKTALGRFRAFGALSSGHSIGLTPRASKFKVGVPPAARDATDSFGSETTFERQHRKTAPRLLLPEPIRFHH
jgi:hypothetical protein